MNRAAKRKGSIHSKKSAAHKGKRRLKAKQKLKQKLVKEKPGSTKPKRFHSTAVNQMLDESHTNGYQTGYRDGQAKQVRSLTDEQIQEHSYNQGHTDGHKQGLYAGGDAIVDTLLPFDAILPETSIKQIIEAGIAQLQPQFFNLQNAAQVTERIRTALDNRTPFSLVRIGDGEVLTMAQETVLSIDQVKEEGKFLSYAGVDVPNLPARDQLVEALKRANVVGIPKLRNFTYQPLAFETLRAHGIDYRNLSLTHSLVNYYIYKEGRLSGLLRGRRVLLVGNVADALSSVLSEHGITVSGIVTPVHGVKDIQRVMEEVSRYSFDIALVSSGISAVTISQRIATELGRVAIDFGHLADELAGRKEPFY
jgi:hypothetical protein